MKDGVKTSEFWFATITAIVVAIIGLLVGYKILTAEQAELWIALAVAVVPAALAAISYGYGRSRQGVKESYAWQREMKEDVKKD